MPFPFVDDDEADEQSAEAWDIARAVIAALPPPTWPPLPVVFDALPDEYRAAVAEPTRAALQEAYFYGVALAEVTIDVALDANGIRWSVPELSEPARLRSYETLLSDRSPGELRMMATRFDGLAKLCRKMIE